MLTVKDQNLSRDTFISSSFIETSLVFDKFVSDFILQELHEKYKFIPKYSTKSKLALCYEVPNRWNHLAILFIHYDSYIFYNPITHEW